ncbi:MAG: hypothetical protein WC784_04860 [Candidatus Shapirobacteria bacterium]|jgi:hypothetical protein
MALANIEKTIRGVFNQPKIETPVQRKIEAERSGIISEIKVDAREPVIGVINSGNNSLNNLLNNVGVVGGEYGQPNMSIYLASMTNGILTRIIENGGITHDLVRVSNELVNVAKEEDMGLRTRMIIGMCESILEKSKKHRVGEVSQRMPELFTPWLSLMDRIVRDKRPLIEQLKRGRRDEKSAERALLRTGEIISRRGDVLSEVAEQYNTQLEKIKPMNTINVQAELLATNMRMSLMQDAPINENNISNWRNNRNGIREYSSETVKTEQLKMKILSGLNVAHTDGMLMETQRTILSAAVWNKISTEFGVSASGLIALAGMAQAVEIAAMMDVYLASKVLSVQRGIRDNVAMNMNIFLGKLTQEQAKMDKFSNTLSGPLLIESNVDGK